MRVIIPDTAPIDVPGNPSVPELKRFLVNAGYPQVENAQHVVEQGGQTVRFLRPVGGEKGLSR